MLLVRTGFVGSLSSMVVNMLEEVMDCKDASADSNAALPRLSNKKASTSICWTVGASPLLSASGNDWTIGQVALVTEEG